jgi:hypothetical protein
MKYIFSKPIKFEDEPEIKEIEIDLDSINGYDISEVKKQFSAAGNFSPILATDTDFCIMMAARKSGKPIEFFKELPGKDYLAIAQGVQNFLLG